MDKDYLIRQAKYSDLDELVNLEKLCFPKEEAATKASFHERLSVFPGHFWLLEKDGHIVSMVNGMVTDDSNLQDEMYHNAKLHKEHGKWQMVFGVATHPKYQNRGYAKLVIRQMIEDVKLQNKKGIVLTCKEKLIPFYEKFGFQNEGISASEHGNVLWYQMRLHHM